MKAKVDKDLCAGRGVCTQVCPEVFDTDENDIAVVKLDPVPPQHEEACRDAADQCPSDAIEIED